MVPPLPTSGRAPNLLGRVPILEYHLFGDADGRWQRSRTRFRQDLELLYARGYRPITVSQLVRGSFSLPPGTSPVVFTFDDASPSQFSLLETERGLEVDPASAVGIWLDFARTHADWANNATFCVLSGAEAGRSFFGDKGIEGQKTEWRHRKLRQLVELGFELCNHTVWHANLAKSSEARVVDQIARLNIAVDSAVPGYRIRVLALPLGEWPARPELAVSGSWSDAEGHRASYSFDAVLLVAGGPARSPLDPEFNPLRLPRVQVFGDELEAVLDRLDKGSTRFVSDGSVPGRK